MTRIDTPIHAALCFDHDYAPYAAVASYALLRHAQTPVALHWVTHPENLPFANQIADAVRRLTPASIALIAVDPARFSGWKESHHFSRAMYWRLLLPELVAAERVLYLDADTLVQADLNPFYRLDLDGALLAGVTDVGGAEPSLIPRRSDDPYLNSGVLLMDLDAMRAEDFFGRAQAVYKAYAQQATWPDQCVINKAAEGRKRCVDARWNRQLHANRIPAAAFARIAAPERSAILHFIGPVKPWQQWCHPQITQYWRQSADALGLPALAPVPITTPEQARELAAALALDQP